jgi:transposase
MLQRVYRGSTNTAWYEGFIVQLLQQCGRFPDPKPVLVMDNASFHFSEKIDRMCSEAGVKIIYLPPYSPRLNPIEELFAELKEFKRFRGSNGTLLSGTLMDL